MIFLVFIVEKVGPVGENARFPKKRERHISPSVRPGNRAPDPLHHEIR
jgi:hypothetical protein